MTRPLVSFVIPAYNAAPTIAETLDSLAECGIEDHEVVIVDDGSTDGTSQLVSGRLAPSWKLIGFDANRGLSTALNTGIALASGLFIARIDADDICMPGRVARQLAHSGSRHSATHLTQGHTAV